MTCLHQEVPVYIAQLWKCSPVARLILSVLKPGRGFIHFETAGPRPDPVVPRPCVDAPYTDLCLYTSQVEALLRGPF